MATLGKTFSERDVVTPSLDWEMPQLEGHSVQFYEDDSFLLAGLSRFIGAALVAGDSAIVIATREHREGLRERLASAGLDLSVAEKQGRYLALDAAETLAQFMVDGEPDASCFRQVVGSRIAQLASAARSQDRRVAVFGEMVALLWVDGKQQAAIHLEQLWNQLARQHAFQLHCAYPVNAFSKAGDGKGLEELCALHSHVSPAEHYSGLQTEEERLRMIALLQQKARALEAEVREREKLQAQQAAAQRHLAAIVECSDDAIASKDLNGVVTSWNKSAERMFGYKAQEIIGKPILMIIPPELHGDEEMILGKVRRGERLEHFETVRLTKSGERIDVSLTVSPVRDEQGKVVGAAKIVRDITEQKKIERALHTNEKLAAAGRLAATVAHEINNPLEAVTNLVFLASRDLPDHARVAAHLDLAGRELDRIAHIARQTLGFYRDTSAPVRFSLTRMLDDVLSLYEEKLEIRKIHVLRRYEGEVAITSLEGEIRQAVSNLIVNAMDAMPRGGSLVIKARAHAAGVRVTILDDGCGIEPRLKKELFQPFFTTKKDVGTGLGLWVTRNIVSKHRGRIRIKSSIDQARHGTAVSVFLPQATEQ